MGSSFGLSAPSHVSLFEHLAMAMKAMKAMKVAKAMKARKAKRVSTIAKGRFAKALVFRGSKVKTVGSLNKASLMKNKRGKIVSKRASARGKQVYKQVKSWTQAFIKARKELGVKGFVALGGNTQQGKALYKKTKEIHATLR